MKCKVYIINSNTGYQGNALVAAESADEANKFIDDFDSWGYCHVNEGDAIEDVYAERKGILYYGIYYDAAR